MKRLREKLGSQSGASILLAMLMFLVCCMAAASIIAAAASNAGKMRSSRVEQQKQLTLSSALELVCGELEKVTYTGKYTIDRWTVQTPSVDAWGNPIYERYFYCKQEEGSYSGGLASLVMLKKELDHAFGRQFSKSGFERLTGSEVEETSISHRLTVSLPAGLSGYLYPANPVDPKVYEVSCDVTMEAVFNHDTWHITVKAWLGQGAMPTDNADIMSAELKAVVVPAVNCNAEGRSAGVLPKTGSLVEDVEDSYVTEEVKWELNWIRKGE